MHRFVNGLLLVTLACVGCAIAQEAKPQATISTQSSVDEVLDALEQKGRDMHALRADVKLTETDTALGDTSARSGTFVLQNRPDGTPRAHIIFDRKIVDDRTVAEKLEYLLADGKLVDRNYPRTKQVTRAVLRPGEKMNLLKLGEGPFPLPIGQKRDDVLAQFDVKRIETSRDDPPDTVHLELTPKPKTPLARKFKTIDTWVSVSDQLPVRISTLDFNGTTERATDLSNVQINPSLTDADFALPKIDEGEWELYEESYQDGNPGR